MSGLPVQLEDLETFKQEWKTEFDRLQKVHGNDMLSLQKDLAALDESLRSKYKIVDTIELPKSLRAWTTLLKKYEAPVMLAQSSENIKEFLLIIMDEGLGV